MTGRLRVVPDRAEFRRRAAEAPLVPVHAEVVADLDTPVSAFARLGHATDWSFLLESVEGGEHWARQSLLGVGAQGVLRVRGGEASLTWLKGAGAAAAACAGTGSCEERFAARDALAALEAVLGRMRPAAGEPGELPAFHGGAVGVLAYDAVRRFDGVRIPVRLAAPDGRDEAVFVLTDVVVVFDNRRHRARLVKSVLTRGVGRMDGAATPAGVPAPGALDALWEEAADELHRLAQGFLVGGAGAPESATSPPPPAARSPSPDADDEAAPGVATDAATLLACADRDDYLAAVRAAKEHLVAGDVIQVVLSQRFAAAPGGPGALEVYRALRQDSPSPYLYLLAFPGGEVVGASPEVLCRVEDGTVTVRPIAGTRRRGIDAAEDRRLEDELRADPKERAEHVMLLDLGRNDVGRVAQPGSVAVPERMAVERYSHVMHLVSTVTGRLRADLRPVDALRAAFPAGTLTGAPKVRAMQIIETLEPARRGPYGGAVGWVAWGGRALDTAICIRTLWREDGRWMAQAGAGIVLDSDPACEHDECLAKSAALGAALRRAARGVR
ncbi:MAG TPA: anthranilate synthase component I family protein [Myxococcota bacterium]|jgi:anthranilate synthase component 1|nr:anthranilate synthase component I family protein [Myxococcota bacterium]